VGFPTSSTPFSVEHTFDRKGVLAILYTYPCMQIAGFQKIMSTPAAKIYFKEEQSLIQSITSTKRSTFNKYGETMAINLNLFWAKAKGLFTI
jgi:hypothetical protein